MSEPQTISFPQAFAEGEAVDAICAKHGAYKARVIPGPFPDSPSVTERCAVCIEDGRNAAYQRQIDQQAKERRRRVDLLNAAAGIPRRFQERSLDNYRAELPGQKRVLAMARRFVDSWPEQREKGTSLVMTGGPGTGKTHIACAIARELMEQHFASVSFSTVTEALRFVKDTYRKDSERTEIEALNRLMEYDLLILDEIGVQLGTDHEKLLLFEILNGRYQDCLPTILLSNLSAEDLESYLGQRVMDRYRECGAVMAFDWPSHRGKA